MFIIKLGHESIVLRMSWLQLHDVAIMFASNTVTFGSQYCITHCHDALVTIQGLSEELPWPVFPLIAKVFEPRFWPQRQFRENIIMLNGSSFLKTLKSGKLTFFKAWLYDVNKAIEAKDSNKQPLEEIISKQYHEFRYLFSHVLAYRLPPHRLGINHEVHLKDGKAQTWGQLYGISTAKLVVLHEAQQENISKGYIRQLSLPFTTRVMITKKPDGGHLFCLDDWHINRKTVNNW